MKQFLKSLYFKKFKYKKFQCKVINVHCGLSGLNDSKFVVQLKKNNGIRPNGLYVIIFHYTTMPPSFNPYVMDQCML